MGAMTALTDRCFSGVIFDMDGTLIDSTPAVVRSWTRWAEEYEIPEEKFGDFHGMPARSIVAKLMPPELHEESLARVTQLELDDVEGIVALPGAVEALAALPVTAIATSCTRDLAERRIAASGIPAPDVVVTASDVTHGKPDPEPFLLAAERLGIDPRRALVVEDATSGIRAGQAAGASTLAVVTTTQREALSFADLVVDDLSAVSWHVNDEGVSLSLR